MAGPKFEIEQVKSLQVELDNKSDKNHTHDSYISTDAIGASDGVAPLVDGQIPAEYVPAAGGAVWGNITGSITDQADLKALFDTKLSSSSPLDFGNLTDIPTTLSGHGITDAYTKTEADNRFLQSGAYALSTLEVSAGSGLLGGGTLDGDLEFSVDTDYLSSLFLSKAGTAADSSKLNGVAASKYVRTDQAAARTSGNYRFNDNVALEFGTGTDASMSYDGSNLNIFIRDNVFIKGADGLTTKFNFGVDGSLICDGDITAFSDKRLKKDINKISNALEKVMLLEGCTWTRKSSGAKQTGLIAQDVARVLPEAVHEDDTTGYLSIAYGNLAGLFVEALKELKELVDKK